MLLFLLLPLASLEDLSKPELQESIPLKDDSCVDLPAVFGVRERTFLDFIATVKYDGMGDVQEYFVTTEDGYKLRLFRLKPFPGVKCKGPLLWWHGMFLSGDTCIILGKGCQCYEYVKKGYDVWVANSRGNRYSRNHTKWDPDRDAKFWNYGLLKMALYDVSAVLKFILKVTGRSQLVYVCHSQGCTLLMILCACRPEYNALVSVAFGQSPTFWLNHSRTPLLEVEAALAPGILVANKFGIHAEIVSYRGLLSSLAKVFCAVSNISYPVCMIFVYVLFGYNRKEISKHALQDTVGKEPSGASLDIFGEWGFIKKHGFKMLNSTEYPLENVTLKWCFCVSENDYVAHLKDVMTLLKRLKNVKYEVCVLDDKYFGHLDHVMGVHSTLYDARWVTTYLENDTMEGCVGRVVTAPDTDLLSTED